MKTRVENIVSIFARNVGEKGPFRWKMTSDFLPRHENLISDVLVPRTKTEETATLRLGDYSAICVRFLCNEREAKVV